MKQKLVVPLFRLVMIIIISSIYLPLFWILYSFYPSAWEAFLLSETKKIVFKRLEGSGINHVTWVKDEVKKNNVRVKR